MRRSLFTAVAVAPLVLLCGAPALAATTISGTQTTPENTSTANNGQPDDVTITGSVNASPVAVTLDSNNVLTNSGSISITDVDNSTGVQILGGHTGTFTNSGSITVSESYVATDTNNDGVLDGPYAKGTGRYGVHVTGTAPFIGSLTNATGGSITVNGNNSFGLSVDAPLQGDLLNQGTIILTGDNSTALSETGGVSGKIQITGATTATGGSTTGAFIGGNVGGALSIYSTVESTGYRTVTRSTNPAVNALLLPEDLLQANPALNIQANVAGGAPMNPPPAGTVATNTTTDADHDGIVDSVEGSGSVVTYGSAPALSIGASGKDVHLGAFGTGTNAYGLIVEGSVAGNGVFDNNAGNGMQIGVAGGTVHIDGGINVVGSVTSQGYEADSTAIHFGAGAVTPALSVEGTVGASDTSAKASSATAILLDAGSSLTSLTNSGTISAGMTGDLGSAYAIVDKSGSLSHIVNTNSIVAGLTPGAVGDTTVGKTIALDLSANTTGVTLIQNPNPNSTTTTPIVPSIKGDIMLGSGNDSVQVLAGSITGALDFGAGQGSLVVDNGATFTGALRSSGVMSLNANNGVLEDDSASAIAASSLHVGASGILVVTADPANNAATRITVAGPATIDAGGQIGLHLLSLPTAPESFIAISSPNLSVGSTDAALAGDSPYLFVSSLHADTTAGTVTVNLRRRTAAEAGLNLAQSQAFDAVYNDLPADADIQRAFLAQTTQAGLAASINQMLPDYAGGVFRALSWAAEAQGVATGDAPVGQEQAGPTRAWTQEIVLHENKDPGQAAGYNILGFGAIGGIESVSPKGNALGVKFGFTTAEVRAADLPSDNLEGVSELNAGVYWRGAFGGLHADAQLGAGYVWINNRREFLYSDSIGVVHNVARGDWSGYTLSGRVGLHYTAQMGIFYLEPRVHADYFRAHEGGYTETGGGEGYDLTVSPRSGDLLSVTGSLLAGATFGEGFRWRPQIEVGYRSVLSGSAGDTTAVFEGGSPFTLAAESIRTNAIIGRVGLRVYSDYLDLLLDGGVDYNKDYTDIDVRLTARTLF